MDVYHFNFAALIGLCAVLLMAQRDPNKAKVGTKPSQPKKAGKEKKIDTKEASQWPFLTVYGLVMGSDWLQASKSLPPPSPTPNRHGRKHLPQPSNTLQGPFLYSLYREEHKLSASLVSTLFTTGFASGALSAYVTGTLADAHGRKRACLVFCAAAALSCILTVITPTSLPLLILGRVLGGVATSLLFTVFDSWMVTDFRTRELGVKGVDLSHTFGMMSMLNSGVAIVSGVFSEWVVGVAGTRRAPFMVAVGLLGAAAWVIAAKWDENYGDAGAAGAGMAPGPRLWDMLKDSRIVCLGLASTMFEGSMYLFVFFWGPALSSARELKGASGGAGGGLPYGLIFACFMTSILASSLVFNIVMGQQMIKWISLLVGILGVADLCFYLLERPRGEQLTFWLFCLFEACVGMYWPCMGFLKGSLIEDGMRAQLYSVLRVPLNVFVVVALYFTGDGDAFGTVFAVCSRLLLLAIGGLYAMMIINGDALP